MPTPSQTILTPQASAADGRLRDALVRAATRGERTPCSDVERRDYWTSEQAVKRALAVQWCAPCVVISECRAAAESRDEQWHVYGGKDFTPRPYRIGKDTPDQDQ